MVFAAVGRIMKTYPFTFGAGFSCVKTAFSDWLVQSQIERRERIDWKRNATFATFGLFYLGGVQYTIYVPIFTRLFPNAAKFAAAPISAKLKDAQGMRHLFAQVFIDQFVHHPLMYFPVFYGLKEVINGGTVSGGMAKYAVNYQEDLVALWKLWVPSTIINFALMPMHLRIPWVASTSLIWTCIISYMRGSSDVETDVDVAMSAMGGGQGKALGALYNLGTAAKPAYLYDHTKAHLLVTATGRDRIGFIQELSSRVSNEHSNILDVNAYKVGREFVTILLVEADRASVGQVEADLQSLAVKGVNVAVQSTQPWLSDDDSPRCASGVSFTGHLHAVGPDSPGVIQKVTGFLAAQDLDIQSIACHQHFQKALATNELQQLFEVSGVVRAFSQVDRVALEVKLIEFEKQEGIRIGIVETEPDPSFSAFAPESQTNAIASNISRLKRSVTGQ